MAFAGAGFLLSKLNHNGYEDEIKRHNKALEDLAEGANRALRLLQKVKKASAADHEPTIHDFYEPSNKMKKYQDIAIGGIDLVTGASIMKIISLV